MDINTDDCCLWHPVSLDKIELPELTELTWPLRFDQCIVSKPPTEPDCHILFIASKTKFQNFCQIRDDQFVTQTLADNGNKMRLSTIASFQRKIYGVVTTFYRYQFFDAAETIEEEESVAQRAHIKRVEMLRRKKLELRASRSAVAPKDIEVTRKFCRI
ncbi:hypothetical protein BUALT_Bualt14G0110500 [Buddleja alternifolia]|uniref:KIB1-4 beta-propeller domain-containing protein n=1 Tax=Buddleja alternifolia TaxID=168488 RepID=A0AAV6WTP8_9LAMI|nr:hypothetical protein BUALT_Bualt14G0110500 [Buddleja alternifolia]